MVRITQLLILILPVLLSCKTQKVLVNKNTEQDIIEYKVFPELEQHLCDVVKLLSIENKNIFIVIKKRPIDGWKDCLFSFYVETYNDSEPKTLLIDTLVKKSNRKMLICNKHYPVVLGPTDLYFTTGLGCRETILYPELFSRFIIADMDSKTIDKRW